jgi:glycosyltransferase involved in cell wall biosynthesis
MARFVLACETPNLVYLNTVKSACYVRPAIALGIRVVLHSHETGSLAEATLARYQLDGLYNDVRLVACSRAAADALVASTGSGNVSVIHSAVDVDRVRTMAALRTPYNRELAAAAVVGGCGTADHRKGTDLWVSLADLVHTQTGKECPRFIWIGSEESSAYQAQARQLELGEVVKFLPPLPNPYPVLAALHVLTVTSRQDAFPLVVLEAMALGVPVVAFDSGGLREELGPTGILVPPGDINAMAQAVVNLVKDEAQRRRLATAAKRRVETTFGIQAFHDRVSALVAAELGGCGPAYLGERDGIRYD